MISISLIAVLVTCALTGAGALWYLATQLATLATQLSAIVKQLTELRGELHETRSAQQEYAAALADQVHNQDTRLAVLEKVTAMGPQKKAREA